MMCYSKGKELKMGNIISLRKKIKQEEMQKEWLK